MTPNVNLFYLKESIKTYESLIAAFLRRREVLLARRETASDLVRTHIDESLRLNEGAIHAMKNALKSAQENLWVVSGFELVRKSRVDHEANSHN